MKETTSTVGAIMGRGFTRTKFGFCGILVIILFFAVGCILPDSRRPDLNFEHTVWRRDTSGGVVIYRQLCASDPEHPADGFGVRVGWTDYAEPASIRGEYDWDEEVGRIYVLELERNGVSEKDAQRIRDAWKKNLIIQLDVGDEPGTALARADSNSLPVDRWVAGATNGVLHLTHATYEEWMSFAETC